MGHCGYLFFGQLALQSTRLPCLLVRLCVSPHEPMAFFLGVAFRSLVVCATSHIRGELAHVADLWLVVHRLRLHPDRAVCHRRHRPYGHRLGAQALFFYVFPFSVRPLPGLRLPRLLVTRQGAVIPGVRAHSKKYALFVYSDCTRCMSNGCAGCAMCGFIRIHTFVFPVVFGCPN